MRLAISLRRSPLRHTTPYRNVSAMTEPESVVLIWAGHGKNVARCKAHADPSRSTRARTPLSATFLRAGEISAGALDWHQTVNGVCAAAVETVADLCILDLKDDEGNLYLAAAAHCRSELAPRVQGAGIFLRQRTRHAPHPVVVAVTTGRPIRSPNAGCRLVCATLDRSQKRLRCCR